MCLVKDHTGSPLVLVDSTVVAHHNILAAVSIDFVYFPFLAKLVKSGKDFAQKLNYLFWVINVPRELLEPNDIRVEKRQIPVELIERTLF
jgi:hypothetical protein